MQKELNSSLSEAIEAHNPDRVLELLEEGVNPNTDLLFPHNPVEPLLALVSVLDEAKRDPHNTQMRAIAEFLWIHKAILDSTKPYKPGNTYLQQQRAELAQRYPGVLNFSDPALCLCYAAHSALQSTDQSCWDRGPNILNKSLKLLLSDRIRILELVIQELERTELGFFGCRYRISLDADNFQTALLREILLDEQLLHILHILPKSEEQFNSSSAFRVAFREQVLEGLKIAVLDSSKIIVSAETQQTRL